MSHARVKIPLLTHFQWYIMRDLANSADTTGITVLRPNPRHSLDQQKRYEDTNYAIDRLLELGLLEDDTPRVLASCGRAGELVDYRIISINEQGRLLFHECEHCKRPVI